MIEEHKFDVNEPITKKNVYTYLAFFDDASPVDIADFIASRPASESILLFAILPPEKGILAFSYLPFRSQIAILYAQPSERIAKILNELAPDDRTALLESLPTDVMNQLIKYLSPQERELSIRLLGYPEKSVGRLMTPDFIAIKKDWSVREVLDYIRKNGHDSETINYIYVIDDDDILIDDLRIRQLLFASLDSIVSKLCDFKFISLNVDDSEEDAIQTFRRYSRAALPVIDNKGLLLGIVTIDDIIAIAIEEDTEDMQKIGGVQSLKDPYMDVPLMNLVEKRAGWLVILFLGELLTASAMGFFEHELEKAIVLTLFLPLIISSGGNAGSQATTLIIRALSLGEVTLKDWWKIICRELSSGIILGSILGFIGFIRVCIWEAIFDTYGPHWLMIAFTVAFSVLGVVLLGTLTGAAMPLILRRLGQDPAAASAPFVATFVDVMGLILYFNIALLVLRGTLL